VNESKLEKLQDRYNKLKVTIITTGFWKLTNSNQERIRKLTNLKKEIEKWKYQPQN
jgi:hypothetical protein